MDIIQLSQINRDFIYTIFDTLDVSVQTAKDYKYRIKTFIQFIELNGFNKLSLIQFKKQLEVTPNLSVSSKNKYLITAKILLKQLYKLSVIDSDISESVSSFQQNRKHKKTGFNQKEIERIIEYTKSLPEDKFSVRLKAILSLLVFQGLRQIEIIRLDVEDLKLSEGTALIQGKGMDDKEIVYLHPYSVDALKQHLRFNKISSGAVFRGLGNFEPSRITTMTIRREIRKITAKLGIEKSTHGFRHYFITKLLNEFDVRDVRKFSRHRNLEMLIVYDDELEISAKSVEVFRCFNNINLD